MRHFGLVALSLSLLTLAGCECDPSDPVDGGPDMDAQGGVDAETPDAAPVDARLPDGASCVANGGSCGVGGECCSGRCDGGSCVDAACTEQGGACTAAGDCCSGLCDGT